MEVSGRGFLIDLLHNFMNESGKMEMQPHFGESMGIEIFYAQQGRFPGHGKP